MKASNQDQAVERLEALYRYRVLDTEPEVAFDRITALTGKVFAVPIVLINLIDHDRQWSKACYGCNVKEMSLEHSFCKYAIESDDVMVVPDALQDPRFAHNPLVAGEPHLRFYAGAPLKTSEGYNLGALCLIGTEPNTSFGPAQREMLTDFAAMVVDELELRRVARELYTSKAKLNAVIETISDAIYIKDLEGRYVLINPAGAAFMGCSLEEVLGRCDDELFEPDDGAHIQGVDEQVKATGEPIIYERENMMSGKVFLTNKYPYRSAEGELLGLIGISRDISQSRQAREALARSNALLRATFDATAEGVLSVDEHGRVTDYNRRYVDMWRVPRELTESRDDGALVQHALKQVKDADGFLERVREASQNPEGETKDEIELRDGRIIERVSLPQRVGERVAGRVWSFRDVTAWRSAEERYKSLNGELELRVAARTAELELVNEQLRHNAFYDPLTGLANRTLFLNRLDLVIERSPRRATHTFAVLLMDVDRLAVLNDSLGRAAGDELLISLGERLVSCLRPGDTVARVSQDAFAVLLEDVRRPDEVERAVLRFKEEVRKPFSLSAQVIYTSVSIGGVLGDNAAYDDAGYGGAEGVLRDAGIAMTRAKARGRARFQLFSAELRERAFNLQTLSSDLHGVIERQELSVSYQPIVFLPNNTLVGFEALVRWEHPKFGTVAPAEFIPLAEDAGLIIDIDRWVLCEACAQLSRWQRQVPLIPLTINVNLSSQQFPHPDLVEYVQGVLGETGVRPEQLNLEITESVMMQNSIAVAETFAQLKALGIKLYLDDFGTGYSSLSYLQSFPVDALKVDRSFVTNMTVSPERAELIKTILEMARTLKLDVVAEGIETEAQRAQLAALGCLYGQGYLFAKPLKTAEASASLETIASSIRSATHSV